MPNYLYQHPKTKKIVEVFQHMNDKHEYSEGDEKFTRIWTKPQMNVDSVPLDIYSKKDFARITNKGGTVGDLWDRSAELSEKRADKEGSDPLKEGFYKDYKKKNKNREHPEQKRARSKKQLDEIGIKVEFGD